MMDAEQETESKIGRSHRVRRIVLAAILIWLVAAYLLIPLAWEYYASLHPSFDDNPRVTETKDKHPGDPLNVALVGTEAELRAIMNSAEWYPAAALGLESDLRIGADAILKRPDKDAPVSSLFLFGRKEDLAFEQPVGNSPRHRHHVRFWKIAESANDGRPKWIGAAVYDLRVGISHTTGQITHVTAPDVDAERDYLFQCLAKTGELVDQYEVRDFHHERRGRNGGGDLWETDGRLYVGVIADGVAGDLRLDGQK